MLIPCSGSGGCRPDISNFDTIYINLDIHCNEMVIYIRGRYHMSSHLGYLRPVPCQPDCQSTFLIRLAIFSTSASTSWRPRHKFGVVILGNTVLQDDYHGTLSLAKGTKMSPKESCGR